MNASIPTLIEGRFYQPQPPTFKNFNKETCLVWGCIAMLSITFWYIFSSREVIKSTGYEFFKKSHYVVASEQFSDSGKQIYATLMSRLPRKIY